MFMQLYRNEGQGFAENWVKSLPSALGDTESTPTLSLLEDKPGKKLDTKPKNQRVESSALRWANESVKQRLTRQAKTSAEMSM